MNKRLDSYIFDLPVHELRRGYRSDIYFWREKRVLEEHKIDPEVVMQVFQKKEAVLCGVDEAIAVLKMASGYYRDYQKAYKLFDKLIDAKKKLRRYFNFNQSKYIDIIKQKIDISSELDNLWCDCFNELEIQALYDGDLITGWESVMHIKGAPALFAHLETIYLGVLARRTRVATNVRNVVEAAGSIPVLYFPARFDHWEVQGGDGYAAYIGGAFGVSTDAQAEWWGAKASGTVPHALIAAVGGDTVKAVKYFGESYPDTKLVALVDFDNDCVNTSLACARELGDKLWAVRLDTSEKMVDKSIVAKMGEFAPTGVIPELVNLTREILDKNGFSNVKIIVSGGFNPDKIKVFTNLQVPVDAYGVGSFLLQGNYDYTADIVRVDGKDIAKKGRRYHENLRLEKVVE